MAEMVQIKEFVIVFGGIVGKASQNVGFEIYDLLLDEYH